MNKEQRIKALRTSETLKMLNNAQNFALGEYTQGACEMAFIRNTEEGALAVLKVGSDLITLNRQGMLDTQPNIQIRHL